VGGERQQEANDNNLAPNNAFKTHTANNKNNFQNDEWLATTKTTSATNDNKCKQATTKIIIKHIL